MIPARPGALSAFGILVSDVVKDYSRTLLWRLANGLPQANLQKEFRKLEAVAHREFREERWRGGLHYERSLDLRYRGQGYELNVPATDRDKNKDKDNVIARFHDEHQRRYGYHHAGREIELVTLRLRARLRTPQAGSQSQSKSAAARPRTERKPPRTAPAERAPVFFHDQAVTTPVFERGDLVPARPMKGPAVITEYSATTVIPPGKRFWVDASANLLIRIG
jgi:N-methylhydantoinase A